MYWQVPAAVQQELDGIVERLHPLTSDRIGALRGVIGADQYTTVGATLTALFPDAPNDDARRRALLRLVDSVNAVARDAGIGIQLIIDGAKRDGDRRRVGFVCSSPSENGGRSDLAESDGLKSMGVRQADVRSQNKPKRVALYSASEDIALAAKLWSHVEGALRAAASFEFVVRDLHSKILAGDDPDLLISEGLEWADILVVGLTPTLFDERVLWRSNPENLAMTLGAGEVVPVLLRGLPQDCDLRCFTGMPIFGLDCGPDKSFDRIPVKSRVDYGNALADEIGRKAARQHRQHYRGAPDYLSPLVRSRTMDLDRTAGRPKLYPEGTRGWAATLGERSTADIPDLERFLLTWSLDPEEKSLLALLGDSGIGKTIACQRLVRTLWERPGAPIAHYFDLRDVNGIAYWRTIPPIDAILAACMVGSWTESGRPLSESDALERARNLLADSMIWPTVLVVDGLDEVLVHLPASLAQKFTNQLLRLRPVGVSPLVGAATKLMLSCRTHYFADVQSQLAHFRDQGRGQITSDDYISLALRPLRPDQVTAYLADAFGWTTSRVEQILGSIHDLRDLSSRPFLLSQLVDVIPHLYRRQASGETIVSATIYQEMVQQWLSRDFGKHVIQKHHKPDMMAYIAYRLWIAGSRSAEVGDLGRWLYDFLTAEDISNQYAGQLAEVLANDLHTATFLIRRDVGVHGLFRFAHSSLAEYFLAAWLLRCVERNDRSGWKIPMPSRETLQFFGELLAIHPRRAEFIDIIYKWKAPYLQGASELLIGYGLYALQNNLPEISLVRLDLTGADMRDLCITGTVERLVNLAGASLAGARMDRSRFEYVNLRRANLAGAVLDRAVWNHVTTSESTVTEVRAYGALLRRCGPEFGAIFGGVRMVGPNELLAMPACVGLAPVTGHTGSVLAVAVTADGSRVVSGGDDMSVRVWDPVTGECLARLSGHTGSVRAVAVTADGSQAVSSGNDMSVRVWDPVTGECLARLDGHTGSVLAVAVTADGSRVVSGGDDGSVRVWDPVTGECLARLSGHTGSVRAVAVTADGSRVVSGGDDGSVRVWDPVTGKGPAQLPGHTGSVLAVAVTADGSRVVSGGDDGSVRVWDPVTGDRLARLDGHTGAVRAVAVTADGSRVVSGGYDMSVRVWDPVTEECLIELFRHTGAVWSVAVTADGSQVVSSGNDMSVRVWDPVTGECLARLDGHTGSVLAVAVVADGSRVVSGGDDGSVRVWDPVTGECLARLDGHTEPVLAVAVVADGSRVVSGGDDGSVRVWDPVTGECLAELIGHTGSVLAVAVTADGSRVVSGGDDGSVRVWDPVTGKGLAQLPGHTGSVWAVAVTADGSQVVSGSYDGSVRVWELGNGNFLGRLDGHADSVLAVAVTADGAWVISGGDDGSVRVWDPMTGECLAELIGHTGSVLAVAVTADGAQVISGGEDGSVRIWDPVTEECLMSLEGHTDSVLAVAVTPDGSLVVSSGDDGSVRIWDRVTEERLTTLMSVDGSWASWTTDGSQVELLAADEQAWRWLRARVFDEHGRLVSQDPYEWFFPTHGASDRATATSH